MNYSHSVSPEERGDVATSSIPKPANSTQKPGRCIHPAPLDAGGSVRRCFRD